MKGEGRTERRESNVEGKQEGDMYAGRGRSYYASVKGGEVAYDQTGGSLNSLVLVKQSSSGEMEKA